MLNSCINYLLECVVDTVLYMSLTCGIHFVYSFCDTKISPSYPKDTNTSSLLLIVCTTCNFSDFSYIQQIYFLLGILCVAKKLMNGGFKYS